MWLYFFYAALGSVTVATLDSLINDKERRKKKILLEVYRDSPLVSSVKEGIATTNWNDNPIKRGRWSNRKLELLLLCVTEGLVEEVEGKYVLTDMGRLSFAAPSPKDKTS